MPTAITTLRTTLATTLANAGVWSTFAFPPSAPIANSVCVMPDDPYLVPNNQTRSSIQPFARFKIMILVPLLDNQGNLNSIETFAVAVYNKLAAASYTLNISGFSAPSTLALATGDLLTIDCAIEVLTDWS